jgi:hypothetical protein
MAAIKTLSSQYSMYFDMVRQVTDLHDDFERELFQLLYEVESGLKSSPVDDKSSGHNLGDEKIQVVQPQNKNTENGQRSDAVDVDAVKSSQGETHPWIRKLFKRIALHCHPDKVDISDHRKLLSYEAARRALDNENEPRMISVGVSYNELPDLERTEIKKILTDGVSTLEAEFNARQKSLSWTWGMSEDNFEIKAKVLVHAMAERYNRIISEQFALKTVKNFFEANEIVRGRLVGTRPEPRIARTRKK